MIALAQNRAFLYAASITGGLAAWEIAAHNVSRIIVAPPSAVASRLIEGIASGALPQAFTASLGHMIIGLAIAFAIALPLGLFLGRNRAAAEYVEPVTAALYAIPPVAFVPIIVIWCGFQFEARITLVALMSVFEMLFAFSAGARNIPPSLLDVGRSFGAIRWPLIRKVMLPAMLPFVLTGLRLGVVRAIHGMIVAELFFAAVNLGALMKRDAARFDSAGVLAIVVVLAVFGLASHEGLKALEWKLFPQKRA
jgi:ABC-type nitrate/sulfonate/bicarbonate transport system permease component